ncbi:MAG TPA: alpha/beta fold hydrolase [Planctomycetes bacterium]|nr:alpha/beta fold hydrolase [Planctomycetota bacterium]
MTPLLLPFVLFSLHAFGVPAGGPEKVSFETKDKVRIKADFYLERKEAPTILCLPMYRHTRKTYAPLVTPLRKAGFNLLVMDLRGHGESAPELADRVRDRDPKLFNRMHLDVEAAIRFLGERGLDTTRLGLVGASVGCSVALASVVRYPGAFRTCVVMTPGSHYLGIDSIADAGNWPGIPLLILSSEEEAPGVKPVAQAFAGPLTKFEIVPGSDRHGTRMFGKVPGAEEAIAKFLKQALGKETLAVVPHFDPADPLTKTPGFIRKTLRMSRQVDGTSYTLMTFAKGEEWTLSAMVKGTFQGKVRLQVGGLRYELALSTETRLKGKAGPHKGKGDVPFKTLGKETGLQDLVPKVSAASFRGYHWVTLDFPLKAFARAAQKGVALHFLPEKGSSLDLPGKGVYRFSLRKIPNLARAHPAGASRPSKTGAKRR